MASAAAASLLLAEQAATLAGEKSTEAEDHANQAGNSAILANQGANHVADNVAAASQSSARAEAAKEAAELAMTEAQAAALAVADDTSLVVEVGAQVSQLASQVALSFTNLKAENEKAQRMAGLFLPKSGEYSRPPSLRIKHLS